jgi:hypothetical protein
MRPPEIDAAWMMIVNHFKSRADTLAARNKELESDHDLSAGAVHAMREAAKTGLNMNCTFVDDEVRLIVGLAQRAILAGLAADAEPATLKRMQEHVETYRAGHEASLGFAILSNDQKDAVR